MNRSLSARAAAKIANFTFARGFFKPTEWLVRRFSSVGREPFFDPSVFPWIRGLENNWSVIREELDAVLSERERVPNFHEVSREQLKITQDDKWKTCWFYIYGRKIAANCDVCASTTRLIEAVPGMKTAFFSILGPGKHIPEHCGPYAGVLRYHLGLMVPQEKKACRIRVAEEIAHWEEGRSLVFDDTYPHEVWNDTDEYRVVLFLDVVRPLPGPVAALNALAIYLFSKGTYVQEIVEKATERSSMKAAASAGAR